MNTSFKICEHCIYIFYLDTLFVLDNLIIKLQDRYDSKYRYYERFPERLKDRLRDPNYDPRWDPDEPLAPGVLGGWLPELQGECR